MTLVNQGPERFDVWAPDASSVTLVAGGREYPMVKKDTAPGTEGWWTAPGAPADGRSLKELQVETETGMFVLAVQRGPRWIYRPRGTFTLAAGDRLISIGPEEGEEELLTLCGEQPVAAPS